jgi:hypothetical protein
MPKSPAAWSARIFEIVADGPIAKDDIIRVAAESVPPGRAFRSWEMYLQKTSPETLRRADVSTPEWRVSAIRRGSRKIVRSTLFNMIKNRRLVAFEQNGVTYVAMPADLSAERVVPNE